LWRRHSVQRKHYVKQILMIIWQCIIECVFIGKKSEECLMVKITQLITQTIN